MIIRRWNIVTIAPVLLFLLVLLAGCTQSPAIQPPQTPAGGNLTLYEAPATPALNSGSGIADSNNRFSASLYRTITKENENTGSNVFFSPFSISSALALTYEGARGTTADEIRSVFFFPANESVLRQGFSAINAAINQRNAGYTLSTANALWAEKKFAFLPDYTSIAEQYYGANTTDLDFIGQPDASRQIINTWIADRTNNKIQNLLPQGSISPATRLVITNAVYFKGTWEKQFDPNQTTDAPFTKPDGTTVTASMMQQTDEDAAYPYAETEDLQMLTLPYTATNETGLSMIVLLPKGNNLSAIEPYLDPTNLSALEQSASSRRVMVYIPKFKIESQYSLKDTLSTMGMPTAFSTAADFSGMDGTQDLYISDVIHKAYIEVNEEGTEAAAATGVVMNAAAAYPEVPPTVFRADHPFVFFIKENNTGTILFTGQVTDPSSD
ncbi:MAG: serpin family protein [Methanoregula sp.]|uniref:serpin family protein n=1 Tax=Methanoregula sp. TaxID=2052170 RepID=UPI003BAF11D0